MTVRPFRKNFSNLNKKELIIVGTTRPETIFGDTAIAVHPNNDKLNHLIGEQALIPIINRTIPIILIKPSRILNRPMMSRLPQTPKTRMLAVVLFIPIESNWNKFCKKPVVTFPTAAQTKNIEPNVISV